MKKLGKIKTKTDYSKVPNKFHFNIQLRTRGNVFKNKKAYDRKSIKQNSKNDFDY